VNDVFLQLSFFIVTGGTVIDTKLNSIVFVYKNYNSKKK